MKPIYVLLILAVFGSFCFAQKQTKNNLQSGITLNKKLSGLYVSFERLGKRTPLRDDEKGEGVWLRLHNNMRYSIKVCAFGITDAGDQLITYSKNTQMGVKYDVILNPVAITDEPPDIEIPTGYNTSSTCHLFEVKSGKSLLFAIPSEHLVKGLSIKIPFSYEWEDETVNNPIHFVFFNSLDILN